VSPDQCRQARKILKWTWSELADAAGVTTWIVAAFEDGAEVLPFYEMEIRAALEAVGIGFSFEVDDGVVRPAAVTFSPRSKPKGR
jgi:predicted transcriptional regulator